MHHATPLITTIVGGLVLAFILGMLANKLRISPLVGYLLAGVLAGPFTPGFVADTKLAPELAELGVILLMFGVNRSWGKIKILSGRNSSPFRRKLQSFSRKTPILSEKDWLILWT